MQIFCYTGVSAVSIDDLLKLIGREAALITGCEEDLLVKRLLERERLSPTAIGKGALLPHIRLERAQEDLLLFFILSERLRYNTPDGQDIGIVFFIVSPAEKKTEYLRLVSLIVRLIKNEDMISELISNDDTEKMKDRLYEYLFSKRGLRVERG